MKKLLIFSFAAFLSFGFTMNSDSNSKFESECPYLNQIHSAQKMDESACPYLQGMTSKENKSDMKSSECPYLKDLNKNNSGCPYLKEHGEKTENNIKPAKQINLKSS